MNRKYRGVVIAANWKMNKTPALLKAYAETLKSLVGHARWCDIVVCPSFVSIPGAIKSFRGSRVSVGAQDVSAFDAGAYTGEISARQLSETGVRYVIVGHSERRARYGEDDATVGKKSPISARRKSASDHLRRRKPAAARHGPSQVMLLRCR